MFVFDGDGVGWFVGVGGSIDGRFRFGLRLTRWEGHGASFYLQ